MQSWNNKINKKTVGVDFYYQNICIQCITESRRIKQPNRFDIMCINYRS